MRVDFNRISTPHDTHDTNTSNCTSKGAAPYGRAARQLLAPRSQLYRSGLQHTCAAEAVKAPLASFPGPICCCVVFLEINGLPTEARKGTDTAGLPPSLVYPGLGRQALPRCSALHNPPLVPARHEAIVRRCGIDIDPVAPPLDRLTRTH